MTNVKKVMLAIVVVLCIGITTVFATDGDGLTIFGPNDIQGNTNTNVENNVTNVTPNIVTNTNNNTSNYNNTTTLPQTGAGDYMMILIIGVLAVSAVYAYKKIRDYKNI